MSEVHHRPGIYAHGPEFDAETLGRVLALANSTVPSTLSAILAPSPAAFALVRMLSGLVAPPKLKLVAPLPSGQETSRALPPPRSIVIPAARMSRHFRGHTDPLLYGLFRSSRELDRTLSAEGGNVDLWILPLEIAKTHFRHRGGSTGSFSPGLHLPHPKDPSVLIPAREFSELLRDQVLQDWVRAFEALGAKDIVICDTTGVKVSSKLIAPSTVDVTAEVKAQYGKDVVRESTYGPGTYDPARALEGKPWLADHAAIQSIIKGRTHGRQVSYRERVRLDVSFGIDIAALRAWGPKLEGGYRRTFELAVQFYPRD